MKSLFIFWFSGK